MSDILANFKRDGFCVAKGLLDDDEVRKVNDGLLGVVRAQLRHLGIIENPVDLFKALKMLHSADIDRYKRVVSALWRHESVFSLSIHPSIVGFMRKEFGWSDYFVPGGQVALIMSDELRIPNGYFGLIPHQDFPSVQGSLDGVVVWIPLTDVDASNFPMEVIPGSHAKGLLPMIDRGAFTWEVPDTAYREADFRPVCVKKGDVVFMSMFTVHRSSTHGLPGSFRLAVSTRLDNANEATFIDRAYPTAYQRSVHRQQYYEGFPEQQQVDRIFKQ